MSAVEIRQLVALFNAGRHAELEARARECAARDPASGVVWKILGASLGVQGKPACSVLQRAAELLPQDAEAHNNLGNALRAGGQLGEALASCQRALRIRPEFPEAHNNLGNVLRDLGRFPEAAASYRQALAGRPEYADAYNNLGNVLIELGQLQEAAASYRRALEIRPRYAEAYSNLGDALLRLGRLEEAVASCREAVKINPEYAAAHNNLGNALCELGKISPEPRQLLEAVASCRAALAIDPEYAAAHNNLANAVRELGRAGVEFQQLDEALASCRRALQLNPQFAQAHNNLGLVLYDLWETEAAVASYRRALAIRPQYPQAYINLAIALRRLGETLEAEACCRKALESNPDTSIPMVVLASLQADQGKFAEAQQLYQRAVSIDPDSAEAWSEMPRVRRMTQSDSTWLTEALRLLDKGGPPRTLAGLCYGIGKYFDDLREFERAFAYYRRANELSKRFTPRYEPERAVQTVDLLIEHHDREWLEQSRTAQNASQRPILVVGMPRSGTTLAEQILASHPVVFGAGELEFWSTATAAYHSRTDEGVQAVSVLRNLADDYLRLLQAQSADALRVVDKLPGNYQWLGLIHAALPQARIIHMQRNPIDTCLSIYFQNFSAAHAYANDLEDLAHLFGQYRRLMRHWRALLPASAMLEVPYEELVEDQEGWSRKMLDFVGLSWDARCLEFHRTPRSVRTASSWQVRQSINNSSVARWRNYEQFVTPLRRLCLP
jgi:tetratricopeptide (TPR) repeat protein